MLTLLTLNKFTYSHEHTFNRRNQDYTENPVFCVFKANQER